MICHFRKSKAGFTLIELAIVLAIAGLLFAGLWRLMSGGNQQLRDQAAASSQSQLISAAKAFLASSDGQVYMTNNTACGGNCAANANFSLPLPTAANPGGSAGCNADANLTAVIATAQQRTTWCGYIPAGLSAASTNAYGQTYAIRVLRDATAAGSAPSTYSFMILTSGGDVIPDTSGGRITAMIGGDGGFVYSSDVCTGGGAFRTTSCGAYGAWTALVATYGFAVPATGGVIGTRTYYAPEQSSTNQWLARFYINGSTAFNTMKADLFMDANGNGQHAGRSNIYMAPDNVTTTNGGSLNMAQGQINMQAGTINMQGGNMYGTTNLVATPYAGGVLNTLAILTGANVASDVPLEVQGITNPGGHVNPVGYSGANLCIMSSNSAAEAATCGLQLQVQGNAEVTGLLTAFSLYSKTFVYDAGGVVSDMRMKRDIKPLGHELDRLTNLKTVSFTRITNDTPGLGVLAQDVEKTYPQLIMNAGNGMKAVDYTGLIAPAIESIRELKEQNAELRGEIEVLRADVKALHKAQH